MVLLVIMCLAACVMVVVLLFRPETICKSAIFPSKMTFAIIKRNDIPSDATVNTYSGVNVLMREDGNEWLSAGRRNGAECILL